MIYEFPPAADDIRQGDIFSNLPRLELSLQDITIITDEGPRPTVTWEDATAMSGTNPLTIAVACRPVTAIVITQDCDAVRVDQITLCEIKPLTEVIPDLGTRLKDWVRNILKQSRVNLKWFYLPPDDNVGFADRMAVDFRSTITVGRSDLERRKFLRRGRLNQEADEHFRERLSEYYRRYPVDEWYPFNREEFEEYRRATDLNAEPREWQRPANPSDPSG